MFHQHLLSTGVCPSLVAGTSRLIWVLLAAGWLLGAIPLAWGAPMMEEMFDDPFEEILSSLREGRYPKVIQAGVALLEENPAAPVHGMLGVAHAGLRQIKQATEAMQRANATGEPNHQVFVHITQGLLYRSRREFDAAIEAYKVAISEDPKFPLAHITLGLVYSGRQDYEGAELHLQKAIALAPESAYAHTVLGANYRAQKKIQKAFAAYRKATGLGLTDARPHLGLAAIYTDRRMFGGAINAYETALRLNPSLTRARTRLSALYLQVGRYDDAVTAAQTALGESPNSAEARISLGRAYAFQGKFDEAIQHLNQGLRQGLQLSGGQTLFSRGERRPLRGHYLLGLALMAKGDFTAAVEKFQTAKQLKLRPAEIAIAVGIIKHNEAAFADAIRAFEEALTLGAEETDRLAHFLIANLLLSQKKWAEAETHLQEARGFIPRFSAEPGLEFHFEHAVPATFAQVNLATLFLIQGWHDKAIEVCDRALEHHQSNPLALYLRGKALMNKPARAQAIAQFEKLRRVAPQFVAPYFELAELYVAEKSLEKAIDVYHKVLVLTWKDPVAHLFIGALYMQTGQDSDAIRAFEAAIASQPDAAEGYNNLAYLYAERGRDLDEALTLAKRAVELAPQSGMMHDTLGWVYFKRGDYTAAAEQLRLAVQRVPASPTFRYHLGMVYSKSGDTGRALNQFRRALFLSNQFPEADAAKAMIRRLREQ